METVINRIENQIYKLYKPTDSTNNTWSYNLTTTSVVGTGLLDKILGRCKDYKYDVVIVSPEIYNILLEDSRFTDVNFKFTHSSLRLKSKIKENDETICVVFEDDSKIRFDHIILTDVVCSHFSVLKVTDLPKSNISDYI